VPSFLPSILPPVHELELQEQKKQQKHDEASWLAAQAFIRVGWREHVTEPVQTFPAIGMQPPCDYMVTVPLENFAHWQAKVLGSKHVRLTERSTRARFSFLIVKYEA
jgi:hypothetical protein